MMNKGELSSSDTNALFDQGYSKIQAEQYEDAITIFNEALSMDPLSVNSLNFRGFSQLKLNRYQDAKFISITRLAGLPNTFTKFFS